MKLRFVVAAAVFGVTSVWAQAPPAQPMGPVVPESDLEAAFNRQFPLVAGAHQVVDWELYTALVSGDVVTYAAKLDPQVATSLQQTLGKAYQTQQLQEQLQHDKRLLAAFAGHRDRVAAMPVFADGGRGTERGSCRQPLVYVAREFRVVLGESRSGDHPLIASTVAPRCAPVGESAVQITAGRSARFRCWTVDDVTSCGWRLPDMPNDLKAVIENEYPQAIRTRWRWHGVNGVTRVHYPGVYGGRAMNDSVALTVPVGLALEFIDGAGRIRWTADSDGWAASAPSRRRVSP